MIVGFSLSTQALEVKPFPAFISICSFDASVLSQRTIARKTFLRNLSPKGDYLFFVQGAHEEEAALRDFEVVPRHVIASCGTSKSCRSGKTFEAGVIWFTQNSLKKFVLSIDCDVFICTPSIAALLARFENKVGVVIATWHGDHPDQNFIIMSKDVAEQDVLAHKASQKDSMGNKTFTSSDHKFLISRPLALDSRNIALHPRSNGLAAMYQFPLPGNLSSEAAAVFRPSAFCARHLSVHLCCAKGCTNGHCESLQEGADSSQPNVEHLYKALTTVSDSPTSSTDFHWCHQKVKTVTCSVCAKSNTRKKVADMLDIEPSCHGLVGVNASTVTTAARSSTGSNNKGSRLTQPPRIMFWHLEKAGGDYLITKLREALGGTTPPSSGAHFDVVDEHSSMDASHFGPNFFRIGVVREPCDYYVSEFFWGRTGQAKNSLGLMTEHKDGGGSPHHTKGWLAYALGARGRGALYDGSKPTQDLFLSWLKAVVGSSITKEEEGSSGELKDRCGLESIRFWTQVVSPSASARINERARQQKGYEGCINNPSAAKAGHACPCPLGECAHAATSEEHASCTRDIAAFDLSLFDCWLHLDTVDSDLNNCLIRYQKRGGALQVKLNATPVINKAPSAKAMHASARSQCSDMHTNETANLVSQTEASFVSKFGLGQCCSTESRI